MKIIIGILLLFTVVPYSIGWIGHNYFTDELFPSFTDKMFVGMAVLAAALHLLAAGCKIYEAATQTSESNASDAAVGETKNIEN